MKLLDKLLLGCALVALVIATESVYMGFYDTAIFSLVTSVVCVIKYYKDDIINKTAYRLLLVCSIIDMSIAVSHLINGEIYLCLACFTCSIIIAFKALKRYK